MDLKIGPASGYHDRSPQYNLPFEIGCFSRDSDCKFRDDNHQMKFISMPERLDGLHMDLNEGYADYIEESADHENRLELLLKWILSHGEQVRRLLNSSNSKLNFICSSRGVLTAICTTIYEKREEWVIHATKFRSLIYFKRITTEKNEQENKARGEIGNRMTAWGFKFEQYMTSDSVDSKPNTSITVNENEKYYAVMEGKLDNHRMLFGVEVDGVDPDHFKKSGHDPNSPLRYVELKTSRMMTSPKKDFFFRRDKLIRWYLQSYLCGTPKIICGLRDDEGIIKKLVTYNVRDMPKKAKGLWSSTACLNFCSDFLNFLKRCVVKDDPRIVYKFYFNPSSRRITCEELPPGDQILLPDWYTESV